MTVCILKQRMTEKQIEELCAMRDLQCSMKTGLKALPESIHWHFKRKTQKGVFEVTLTSDKTVELSYHNNRFADWVDEEILFWKKKFSP